MTPMNWIAAICMTVVLSTAGAQTPPGRPHFAKQVLSPEVLADHRVTFRLKAPNAKKVVLALEGFDPRPMTVDDHGVWSVTVEPMEPDFYVYSFSLDGTLIADPSNPLLKPVVTGGADSYVHVPGPASLTWESNDVPHGVVHHVLYHSKVIGEDREVVIYTPPGFDKASRKTYPSLYLLHGVMEGETGWTTVGRANVILDNLIATGKCKPMVVVMPYGYGFPDVPNRVGEVFAEIKNQSKFDTFNDSLMQEIVPLVEREFRATKGRNARAIAGASMGGAQALYEGLQHPGDFGSVGAFSGAFIMYSAPSKWFPKGDFGKVDKLPRLTIACGKEDFLIGSVRKFCDGLKSQGVKFKETESPGSHTWNVWKRNLEEFVPTLFDSR